MGYVKKTTLPIFYVKKTISSRGWIIPKHPGVYVFKNEDTVLIVGSTSNLHTRVNSAYYNNYMKDFHRSNDPILYTHIDIYLTEDSFLVTTLEYVLIRKLKPLYNKEKLIRGMNLKKMYEDPQLRIL